MKDRFFALGRICDGVKQPDMVLREQVDKYREVFRAATQQVNKIEESCAKYLQQGGGGGGGRQQ